MLVSLSSTGFQKLLLMSQPCSAFVLSLPFPLMSKPTVYTLLPASCLKNYCKKFSVFASRQLKLYNPGKEFNTRKIVSEKCRMSTTIHSSVLRLDDYDCVGFDLDNTLCEYNLSSSVKMEYSILANFLVKERGYDPDHLLRPLDESSIDFLQKGLFVDFDKGNLLKVLENGTISKASHGSKLMTDEDIVAAYGKDRKWEVINELQKNMLASSNGPLSNRVRALLDYFDMPASLAFGRIVDSLDSKLGKVSDLYNVWPDILAGLHNMYDRDHFMTGEGGYFREIKSNPHKFIKECNPHVLEWLKEIRKSKMTYLITGSNYDFASLTAETGLGKNWQSLFDVVICYARKPGFFTGCRPFVELHGFKEKDPVTEGIELGKVYSQGNWQELYQLFQKATGKKNPKCLYFGDNLLQDVFAPAEYTKCDTVAVLEELNIEISKQSNNINIKAHPSESVLNSNFWGSFFYDDKYQINTLWGSVISSHSKVCVPTLSVLAHYSVNHEFNAFSKSKGNGYFPVSPDVSTVEKKVHVI